MVTCECGWFLRDVVAWIDGLDHIRRVEGVCKRHGLVVAHGWNADMFDFGMCEP